MKKNKQLFILISLLGVLNAKAAIAKDNFDDRYYVAPAATYIWSDEDRQSSRNDYGLSLGLGKAVNENVNLELKGFFNNFEHSDSQNPNQYHWKSFGSSVDLQYYFNRNDLSPYAVVGAGYMNSSVQGKSADGIIGEAGLGLAYKINDAVSLRSDARYRYNDNFSKHLVPEATSQYNEMIVNVGVVIPFGSVQKKVPYIETAPVIVEGDGDNDGVKDSLDKCPDTQPGVKVNRVGCDQGITLTGVNFNFASAVLTPDSKETLDKLSEEMKNYKNKKAVEIQGHTSSEGSEKFNNKLSQERANSVLNYLKNKGVTREITTKGYGSSMPIADNATLEGRIANRRVDFIWK